MCMRENSQNTKFDDTPETSYMLGGVRFYFPPDELNDWTNRQDVPKEELPSWRDGYPSVTSVINVIEKPGLKPAAVNLTVNHMLDTAAYTAGRLADDTDGSRRKRAFQYFKRYHESEWGKKADRGSKHHYWFYRSTFLGEDASDMGDLIEPGITVPLMEWYNSNVAGWVASEGKVYNTQLRYAGSFDGVVELKDGRKAIYDIKTGKMAYNVHHLQLGFYQMCDKMAVPVEIGDDGFPVSYDLVDAPEADVGLVLNCPGDGVLNVYEVEFTEELFQAVRAARVLWDWNKVSQQVQPGLANRGANRAGAFWLDGVSRENWVSEHTRIDCRREPTEGAA